MAGKVIGKTMNLGWAGKVTRDADCIIDSRIVNSSSAAIGFGDPVFLNTDNTVRKMAATDTTIAAFVGVAVSGVRQSINYATQLADYQPSSQCDILTRGSVMVAIPATVTTAPAAGGAVYLDVDNATYGFTSDAGTANVAVTNAKFTTGIVDANRMVEITLLTKNVL